MSLISGALVVVVALLTLVVVGLLRSHGEILRRLHALDGGNDGAGIDARMPGAAQGERTVGADVGGRGLRDDVVLVRVRGVSHRTLLAFLSTSCLTCREFWEAFATHDAPGLGLPDGVRVVVVAQDPAEEHRAMLESLAPRNHAFVMSSAAWSDYSVPGSPYFVLVDGPTGEVRGEGTGTSWEQVRNMLMTASEHESLDRSAEGAVDRALLEAGIRPGDPSLYHPASPESTDDATPQTR